MNKKLIILLLLILNGCAGGLYYIVKVNGYGEIPIINSKRIYVYENKNAKNSLLEKEVADKIKKALVIKGYIPVDNLLDSEYVLIFKYSIDSGKEKISSSNKRKPLVKLAAAKEVVVPAKSWLPQQNIVLAQSIDLRQKVIVTPPSPPSQPRRQPNITIIQPRIQSRTIYTRHLIMHLYDSKYFMLTQAGVELADLSFQERDKDNKPVWVGDIVSKGSSSDLRKVIDALIIAAFSYFGEDTGQQKVHSLLLTDPRIKQLKIPSKREIVFPKF